MNFWILPESEEPLAKPHQTYRRHVQAVLEAHLELWPQTRDYWSHLGTLLIAQRLFNGNLTVFLQRVDAGLRLACATHDLGKLNQGFHLYMCAERDKAAGKKVTINRDWHFRHELLSLPFTVILAQLLSKELAPLPYDLPWEAVAVMGHHKRLDNTLFERERTRLFKPAFAMLQPAQLQNKAWDWVSVYLTDDMKSCRDLPLKFWQEGAQLVQSGGAGRFVEQKDRLRESLQNCNSPEARFLLRWFGASFKAHLQICDWWASAQRREIYGLGKLPASPIQPQEEPQNWLREKLETVKNSAAAGAPVIISWRHFQQQVAALGDYAYCVAPTGSGKTEAALLWALNRMRAHPHLSKILYLLPTTTTANAIHQRLSDLFGTALVGLAHSKAKLLREDREGESEEDNGEVRQNVLSEAAFFPPITVATLDQLLLAGLHGKYWVFRNHALAQSAVILDELHAFDPYTLGLLGAFAPQLRLLHVPVLALSATFPQPLRRLFESWFPATQQVQDHSLLAEARGQWQFHRDTDFADQSYLRKIARRMRGERFLLVRNTVRGAQETFDQLRELDAPVRLLHSAFMQKDRREIEKAIFEAEKSGSKTSLVATQIVEVSLDIDYDHLVSELCPPDALVQRAGRCNRARRKKNATITVLAADEVSHKVYQEKFGIDKILDRSAETLARRLQTPAALTEQDLLDWVNEVYAATDLPSQPQYQEAERDFKQQQHRLGYVLDHGTDDEKLETRWIKEERVPVIPQKIWYGFSQKEQREFFASPLKRAMYSVEIPFWRRKLLHGQGSAMPLEFEGKKLEFFYWVDLPYDEERGLQLPKPAHENLKHTEIF
ncbi:MAG: CRISPR-associated helicase Cas3' [candidate division KSB1 bacterium]|nr:CRISPR-associated helicase Cas3' [candidate division KSB1 bacterium]MDZ7274613.1 CRISPR-associated helicase Cas3' [candidate division KSB1 bacterium]MDZ7285438.1 CRISPR-associated helicase Cas3' [candidate division KSB1 bacterium]MDZ7298470.1 CRISPR-associated helicase Cas3' [candidate division KSB1 bacterium]MDZ7306954.1 CRISPR-associated helicase Cas3' [candidate division KSB1 bacterium]